MNRRNFVTSGVLVLMFVAIVMAFINARSGHSAYAALATEIAATEMARLGIRPGLETPTTAPQQVSIITPTATIDPAGNFVHTVQPGETLYRIALRYNVTVQAITTINRLFDESTIYVGQQLLIPIASAGVTPESAIRPTYDGSIPPSGMVNGIPVDSIIVLPEAVREKIREIYARGQTIGRNPRAFSKLGDSTIENPHFLARFDSGPYNLGNYAYLQPVIDHFAGSFSRQGGTIQRGLHTWSVFDPMWASGCIPGEHILACEFRQHNPSILIIRLGSNDKGVPDSTDQNLRRIVEYCIENGVIPILGTKADRFEGAGNINNNIIRQIAADYSVPLWDFDLVAGTLPGRGLAADGVHMSFFFAHDWTLSSAYSTGHGLHNLTALIALDAVWRAVQ